MLKYLILPLALLLSGCADHVTDDSVKTPSKGYKLDEFTEFHVVRIDGCEYIVTDSANPNIIHKANCDNPVHKR